MAINSQLQLNGSITPGVISMGVIKSTSSNDMSSHFNARITNYAGSFAENFVIGDNIEVFADVDTNPPTTKIFNGILEDIQYKGFEQDETILLTGKDFTTKLIDATVEPEVYTNLPAGSIVQDIINKYVDDISVSGVQLSTTIIPRITFSQIPVFDAIRDLAEKANFVFYVDNNKDLHFEPKAEVSSSLTLDNTNILKANFRERRKGVFNEIWVYGDRYLDGFEETFTGTGSTDVYTLIHKPHNTNITVNGVIQKGAIQEMFATNTVSGVNYSVGYDDRTINFQSGTSIGYSSVPGAGETLIINYKRSLPIVKVGKDNDSIAKFGKRVKVIEDKSIKDPETAQQVLQTALAESSLPTKEGIINIKGIIDVTPSQTCVVDVPFHNVNNQIYEILEANYKFNNSTEATENVLELKVNKKLNDATDTIKQMLLDIKKLQAQDISDSDILTRFEFTTGSYGIRQSGLTVSTRELGSSFILGHPGTNPGGVQAGGRLGSVVVSGINFLGDSRSGFTIQFSGGYF